jgi:uncharacterized protein YhfF
MEYRICEFGFPGPLRDRLVDAVLSGMKTATSSLLADWQRDGEQPPAAGELQTVIDSVGTPVAIIEILRSEVMALGAVDDRVAIAEGESYKTAAGWRSEHERFWREEVFPDWEGHAPVLDDSTPVVVERRRPRAARPSSTSGQQPPATEPVWAPTTRRRSGMLLGSSRASSSRLARSRRQRSPPGTTERSAARQSHKSG